MILTDEEIRKAAEFAAVQMWPESGYVGWTEDDAVFHRKFVDALLAKLRGGMEAPEPDVRIYRGFATHSTDQLLQYGAAQRLAGREQAIEECASECMSKHANGNYKYDTREDCHLAILALAASPQEQQP